jgi:hypothetical protein
MWRAICGVQNAATRGNSLVSDVVVGAPCRALVARGSGAPTVGFLVIVMTQCYGSAGTNFGFTPK